MAEKNSKADYLKAAEIMSGLGRGYEKQVLYFLEKAGLCDEEFMKTFNAASKENAALGRKKNIDPEFIALLKELDELKEPISYSAMMQYWRTKYSVQKSRLDNWREGRSGISNELKAKIMPEIKEYVDAQKMLRGKAKEPSP